MDQEARLVFIYLLSLPIKQPPFSFEVLTRKSAESKDKQKQNTSIPTIYFPKTMSQDVDIKMQNSITFGDASLKSFYCTISLINATGNRHFKLRNLKDIFMKNT